MNVHTYPQVNVLSVFLYFSSYFKDKYFMFVRSFTSTVTTHTHTLLHAHYIPQDLHYVLRQNSSLFNANINSSSRSNRIWMHLKLIFTLTLRESWKGSSYARRRVGSYMYVEIPWIESFTFSCSLSSIFAFTESISILRLPSRRLSCV